MHENDTAQWIKMLAVDRAGPNERVTALEEACLTLEASLANPSDVQELRDRLKDLERSVEQLDRQKTDAAAERDRLEKDVRERIERRRSGVVARLDAARQRSRVAEARKTIEDAAAFFELPLRDMTPAQITQSRPAIREKLQAVRETFIESIKKSRHSIETHADVQNEASRLTEEQSRLAAEIAALEQGLGKIHHVEAAVFAAFGGFSKGQLQSYRDEVLLPRLEDARCEQSHGLKPSVWNEGDQ
jgi:chromosome segregation ATPase